MKNIAAVALGLFATLSMPAIAQLMAFDTYDKADFDRQLAAKTPVVVHVNTTW